MRTGKALGLIILLLGSFGAVSANAEYYYSAQWGNTGYLYSPCAAAVDASGNVYVADDGNARVQKFSPVIP